MTMEERIKARNFRGEDLTGEDMSGLDLSYCLFRDANLTNVNFNGSIFKYANFRGANIQGATFLGSDLNFTAITDTTGIADFTDAKVRFTAKAQNLDGFDQDIKDEVASIYNTFPGADFDTYPEFDLDHSDRLVLIGALMDINNIVYSDLNTNDKMLYDAYVNHGYLELDFTGDHRDMPDVKDVYLSLSIMSERDLTWNDVAMQHLVGGRTIFDTASQKFMEKDK